MSSARGYVFFFIGCLISILQRNAAKKLRVWLIVLSIGLILMYIFAYIHDIIINESLEIGLFIVCPIILIFINFTPLEFICENKVVKLLGAISFGIFLWNLPVFIGALFFDRLFQADFDYSSPITYLLVIAANIGASVLSYILCDKMFVNKIKSYRENGSVK